MDNTYKELKKLVNEAIDSANEFLRFKEKILNLTDDESLTINMMGRKFIVVEIKKEGD